MTLQFPVYEHPHEAVRVEEDAAGPGPRSNEWRTAGWSKTDLKICFRQQAAAH